jgi:hypothetical protein
LRPWLSFDKKNESAKNRFLAETVLTLFAAEESEQTWPYAVSEKQNSLAKRRRLKSFFNGSSSRRLRRFCPAWPKYAIMLSFQEA